MFSSRESPHFTVRLFFVMVLCLTVPRSVLQAQERAQTGTITGIVIDRVTNAPLVGANVLVAGTMRGASSDTNGVFRISGVPLGACELRISCVGYLAFTVTDVVVTPAKPVDLVISLMENTLQVEAVQVTASYFQKLPDTPVSSLTQSNEEIRRLPGGLEDVVRAISILPGVAQVQAGRNDLIVRGGAPSENFFLIDNIEVPNINHFGTQGSSGGPLSYINLDFVERTTFSAGGFGVRYGDKLSSVLAINLRDGRKDRLGGKATISASQFGLNLEGPAGPSGDFIFSARRSYLDFFFKAAGFSFVPEYWDFLAKGHYHLGVSDHLEVLGIAALDRVKFFNDTPEQRFDNSRILGSDENQAVVGASWRHLFGRGFSDVTLAETYTDFHYGQLDSLLAPIFSSNSIERELTLRGDILIHATKSVELSFGVSGKRPDITSRLFLKKFWTNYGELLQVDATYATTAFKGAAYAQVSKDFEFARITVGGRADYFNLIDRRAAFSPRFSSTIPVTEATNFNVSVGIYRQAPSYIWLASNPLNRNLDFIKVSQYVVGIEHTPRPDSRVTVEVYMKDYSSYPASLVRSYLVLANTGAGFGGSDDGYASFGLDPLVSKGSGRASGVELMVQKKLSDIPCYGTASVSYSVSSFRALDGVLRPSNWDQRWIVNLGGGYVLREDWEFSAKFRYVSGRPYTPYNPDGTQDESHYNNARIQPNHSLDIRADRRWFFDAWTLITYVDIQNVYNRKPIDIPRYDERTKQTVLVSSIGILPSVGISAEF